LEKNVDYACNNMPPSWPHGLDCEAYTLAALRRVDDVAREPLDREHPTRFMRSHVGWSRVSLLGPGGDWAQMRLTLDTPEDLALFEGLLPRLGDPDRAGLSEIAAVLRSDHRLADLTAGQELHHGIRREAPSVAYTDFLPAL
jgi:spore coat polysaccharide biosynthesis protein SpsF (cytidylyltransferase family)